MYVRSRIQDETESLRSVALQAPQQISPSSLFFLVYQLVVCIRYETRVALYVQRHKKI